MIEKLNPEQLYKRCNPDELFAFNTTNEIADFKGTIGQEKALRAMDFGLTMDSKGFNIFALGENGTGKMSTIMNILQERALQEKVPGDWCYVYNFKNPDVPLVISLGAGMGFSFQKEIENFIKILKSEIPKAFEAKEYEEQKIKILEQFQEKQAEYFSKLDEEAKTKGFAVKKGPSGVIIVPVNEKGELFSKEEYDALDEEVRKQMEETGRILQGRLNDAVRVLKETDRIVRDMLAKLEHMVALDIVGPLIEGMKVKYSENKEALAYFESLKEEALSHLDDFRPVEEEQQQTSLSFLKIPRQESSSTKYIVNVFISNDKNNGAPVVFESNPTYLNLFGRIEYKVTYGMAITDFSLMKPGSVHRANGGYLILNADDLLKNPFSYDALKRALKNKEIRIEDALEQYRMISTPTLKPQAIPLNVKVILMGNPHLYYLLHTYDEESRELFKVKVDFDNRIDRTQENMNSYATFIAHCQREEKLLPLDRSGVAKIIEFGSRFADQQNKLSVKFSDILDLLRESNYWALKADSKIIIAEHVSRAVTEGINRVNRVEERIREMMIEGTLIVDTEGTKIGQVNGLAVLDLGDYIFGKPSRITAKTFSGRAGVVNIERETKMSGKIHEKAIMIISSYLGSKYAIKKPITLSASITFEQLYETIEGDSATCAELYALLSSLSGVPLKQCFAVTGSMDQNGDVQPIGGVNQKIEGFFDLCKIRGLNGNHGVIIPKKNALNLFLKEEIVSAVNDGKFSVYTVEKMEEGLEILTGIPAGELNESGEYPEGTLNFFVARRLTEIAEALEKKKVKEKDTEREETDVSKEGYGHPDEI